MTAAGPTPPVSGARPNAVEKLSVTLTWAVPLPGANIEATVPLAVMPAIEEIITGIDVESIVFGVEEREAFKAPEGAP